MSRTLRSITLTLMMILSAASVATAQRAPDPPQKDVTDGFFDMPVKEDPDGGKGNAVPGYLVTALLGGIVLFAVCKTSRRGV